jgi:hypothetical protein
MNGQDDAPRRGGVRVLGSRGIVFKRNDAPYRSDPPSGWIKTESREPVPREAFREVRTGLRRRLPLRRGTR